MELQISDLQKTYANGVHALRGVSLTIPTGMYGLLGPNGAGKSTLMRILATLQEADSGRVSFGDVNVLSQKEEVRRFLGYLPQEFGFYPRVRAQVMLEHFATLKGLSRAKERKELVESLLRRVNLWEARKRKLGEFSGGMKQRFGIAQALLGNPRLIVVDEPTAGLDPQERNRFLNLLSEIGENVVVILSTHIVEDVSGLCSRMAVINRGSILLEGEPQACIAELQARMWEKSVDKADVPGYQARFNVLSTRLFSGKTLIRVFSEERPDSTFAPVEARLEDVYFRQLATVN